MSDPEQVLLFDLQASDGSAGGGKAGLATLMRRAVQQAKTEAAAQAAAGTHQAYRNADEEGSADRQTAGNQSVANKKKAMAAVLQKAAREMQKEEEAESAAAKQGQGEATGTHALTDLLSDGTDQQYDGVDPEQLQLSGLIRQQSGSSSDSISTSPLYKTQSLGNRLGSVLKNAFSPSRQSSYVPLDPDSSPEPQEANESAEQRVPGTGRRALPRDASLSQRLGSILSGGLSIPRQSSYTSVSGDNDFELPGAKDGDDSAEMKTPSVGQRTLPRDASLGQRLGSILKGALSIPRQPSYTSISGDDDFELTDQPEDFGRGKRGSVSFSSVLHDADSPERVLPRELSLRERYGSLTLSRDPSYSFPVGNTLDGPGAEHDSTLPVSPGRRRALPRDASYLPEWVTRSRRQTARGNGTGSASPKCRLGTSVSNASSASDTDWDATMPTWVDWPQTSPQPTPQQAGEEAPQSDSEPAVPILLAPPRLRGQQQQAQKAEPALPRAKRPLSFASNPLSLSLIHTPSMNPQLDLKSMTPVATPKGQRLFDFWHQKSEQQASAATAPGPVTTVAPFKASEVEDPSPATSAGQPGNAQQSSPSTAQQAESPSTAQQAESPSTAQQAESVARAAESDVAQLDAAGAAELAYQPASVAAAQPPHQSQQLDLTAAAPMQSPNVAGSVRLGTESAAFVAELQTATRLVHKQSLQQEALLEGIERALSQLSEQRLLIQNPQAAGGRSRKERVSNGGMLLLGARTMKLTILHAMTRAALRCLLQSIR